MLSAGSKKRLTVEEVAARIKASDDFEPDLHELYSSGLTAAEAKAANALAAAAKVKQDAIDAAAAKLAASEAKAAEIKAAADLKAVQAENAKLAKQVAANAPPQAPIEAPVAETPPPAEPVEPAEAPANIVAMAPPAPRKRTAADLCNTLDSLFSDMADLNPEEQAVVGAKLMELADIVAMSGIIQTPSEQAAPEASKRKAA